VQASVVAVVAGLRASIAVTLLALGSFVCCRGNVDNAVAI